MIYKRNLIKKTSVVKVRFDNQDQTIAKEEISYVNFTLDEQSNTDFKLREDRSFTQAC